MSLRVVFDCQFSLTLSSYNSLRSNGDPEQTTIAEEIYFGREETDIGQPRYRRYVCLFTDFHFTLTIIRSVAHRVRQFESWLADALENFRIHQEGLVSRVPRLVRGITLRDFAKYNGDVQACLKGLQRERLGGEAEAIDKTTRKRKWVESQEAEAKVAEVESTKGVKSGMQQHQLDVRAVLIIIPARMNPTTPRRAPGVLNAPGTGQRSRLPTMKTPGTVRVYYSRTSSMN